MNFQRLGRSHRTRSTSQQAYHGSVMLASSIANLRAKSAYASCANRASGNKRFRLNCHHPTPHLSRSQAPDEAALTTHATLMAHEMSNSPLTRQCRMTPTKRLQSFQVEQKELHFEQTPGAMFSGESPSLGALCTVGAHVWMVLQMFAWQA